MLDINIFMSDMQSNICIESRLGWDMMAVVAKVRPETFMRCKYYLYIRGDAHAGIMNQRQAIARGLVVWGWCGLFSAEEYCRAECVYVRIRRREIELAPNLWLQDAHDDVDDDDDSI